MLHRLKNMTLNLVEKIRIFILEKNEIKKFTGKQYRTSAWISDYAT